MTPGFLTTADARGLTRFAAQAEADRRAIERRRPGWRDHFAAKLTSTDGAGRFGWTEQAYDGTGTRYDKPGGRTGAAAWMPAYAVGTDGTGPLPTALPVQTWLRHVIDTAERGPVYEFDWTCACVGGYSGSGADIGVVTGCCPGHPIPRTIHVTIQPKNVFSVNVGSPVSWPLVYDAATDKWRGTGVIPQCNNLSVTYEFFCFHTFSGGTDHYDLQFNWLCAGGGIGFGSYLTGACDPFLLSTSSVPLCSSSGSCSSYTHTVTV
jgi:hypothetical protein